MNSASSSDPIRPTNPDPTWDRISAELRAQREAQKKAWGDIDNTTLGRYIANEVSGEERQQIEEAINDLPELRLLTDLVRDVLADFEPLPISETSLVLSQTAPGPFSTVNPFPDPLSLERPLQPPHTKRGWFNPSSIQRAILAMAACLMLSLGLWMNEIPKSSSDSLLVQMNPGEAAVMNPMPRGNGLRSSTPMVASHMPQVVTMKFSPLDQIDQELEQLQKKGNLVEAIDRAERISGLAKEAQIEEEPRLAMTLNRVGQLHEMNNDLNQAEANYARAYTINQKKLNPEDPALVQTVRNLGNTYQLALNETAFSADAYSPLALHMPAVAAPASTDVQSPSVQPMATPKVVESKKVSLAERITHQPTRQVRKAVVPVLVQALQHADKEEERLGYLKALARLGPAAREAAPVLIDRLTQTESTKERLAVLLVLSQLGPMASEQAVPVLQKELNNRSAQVRQVAGLALLNYEPAGTKVLQQLADVGDRPQQETARSILQAAAARKQIVLRINDPADLFTLTAQSSAQQMLAQKVTSVGLTIHLETNDTLAVGESMESRGKAIPSSDATLTILMNQEPPRAVVLAGSRWIKRGLNPQRQQELQALLEKNLQGQTYDDALQQGLGYLLGVVGR